MYLVVGATGTIGRHVVTGLAARGLPVRALSRDLRRAEALQVDGLDVVVGDLADADTLTRALDGVEAAFLVTPGTEDQPRLERAFLDAAVTAGLARLVKVSLIGPSPDHFVRYARWQAAVEQHLAATGLPATVLRPSWFDENFLGSAPTITGQGAIYGSAGTGRVGFVDSRDTAAVAVAALTEDGHAGRDYTVTGPAALTFAEAAEQLAEGLGRPVTYVDVPDDGLRQALRDAGLPDDVADDVVAINVNARQGGLQSATSTVADLTGTRARSLATWARDNAAAFTG